MSVHAVPSPEPVVDAAAVTRAFDRVSHAFEGSAEARRLLYTDYLQFFRAGDVVVDVACGDGTWLHLLKGAGVGAFGFDADQVKVDECLAKGLDVVQARSLAAVAHRRPNALTAFHIVEHLQPLDAMEFLMTLDVRKVLLVTPNIDFPPVLASFWRDVTHVRPYPCCVLEAMCREAGFAEVMSGTQNGEWDSWVLAWKPGGLAP